MILVDLTAMTFGEIVITRKQAVDGPYCSVSVV